MILPDRNKLSAKDYRDQVKRIRLVLAAEVGGWPREQTTAAARRERLARCEADPFEFFREYLPHYFSNDFAPFHYELIDLIAAPTQRELHGLAVPRATATEPVAVAAPRAGAKSTLVSFGYVLHQIVFTKRHFVVIGSDTADLAEDLTSYIKLELENNLRLQHDFGKKYLARGADGDFIAGGTRVLARGSGQRVRGIKHGQHRPDLIILDDLENDKNVKNPRLVKENLNWIVEAVYPALDPLGSLFIIGTILSKRSALATIINSQEEPWKHWKRVTYRALIEDLDGTVRSFWPDRYSVEDLLRQKRIMGSVAFNKEKQNDPRDDEGMFREEWYKYFRASDVSDKPLMVAGFFDPSTDRGGSNDYKAFVTVGLYEAELVYYVLGALVRRSSLSQLYGSIVAKVNESKDAHVYSVVGMEDNGFQSLAVEGLEGAAKGAGVTLPLRTRTSRLSKETRLAGLSPLVERGVVRFLHPEEQDPDYRLLMEQLTYFPSSTVNDDGPDALEGAVDLLKGSGVGVW